ncbi:MAG: diguanylate cyclase [Clostridia bacterium]|nr:diguanylate cyclase [Clostridia bacterium]
MQYNEAKFNDTLRRSEHGYGAAVARGGCFRMAQNPSQGTALPEVYVAMLGKLELRAGRACVGDDVNRSRKMWNLLAYLLTHRAKEASQQELIEALWPGEDCDKPANALKTLMYRIRRQLEPIERACGAELILSHRGGYRMNRQIDFIVDTNEFELLLHKADDISLPVETRIELYTRATALYGGDFLPKQTMELWVVPLNAHYHALYLSAVKTLASLLEQEGHYAEMAELCSAAIAIDPLDERLHSLLVQALLRQGKDAAALNHYETATELLYRNLGVKPSEELRALYAEIMKTQKSLELDLGVVQRELMETETLSGAFVCEYGFFKEAYRLEARRAARYGMSVFVALMTVATPSGEVPSLELLNVTMEQLLDVIKSSLRKGDIVARYSGAQYVIMLPALTFEDGENVMDRIVTNFRRQYRRHFLKLHYKLQQLELTD